MTATIPKKRFMPFLAPCAIWVRRIFPVVTLCAGPSLKSRTSFKVRFFLWAMVSLPTAPISAAHAHDLTVRHKDTSFALGMRLAAQLATRDSATAVLQSHCPVPIKAQLLDQTSSQAIQRAARHALAAPAEALLAIRHVYLLCGTDIRSEAWNLYLPSRLTPSARHSLADGHTPFGRAVGEHTFWRQRLSRNLSHLPPGFILENRALLRRVKDGIGFSYLIERYTYKAALTPSETLNTAPKK